MASPGADRGGEDHSGTWRFGGRSARQPSARSPRSCLRPSPFPICLWPRPSSHGPWRRASGTFQCLLPRSLLSLALDMPLTFLNLIWLSRGRVCATLVGLFSVDSALKHWALTARGIPAPPLVRCVPPRQIEPEERLSCIPRRPSRWLLRRPEQTRL